MHYVRTHSEALDPSKGKSAHFVINWSGVVAALSGRRSTVECQNRYQTLRRNMAKSTTGDGAATPPAKAASTTTDILTTMSSAVKGAVALVTNKGGGKGKK
jgi:hypothetical protein